MSRTSVMARAALNTTCDILALSTLPVLYLREFCQQIWLQAHRTNTNTLGTADARLWFLAACFFVADDCNRVGSLTDGHLVRCECLTHHWSTCQQLVVALRHTATEVDKVLHRSTHSHLEVTWVGKLLTCNCGVALKQRLILHHCLVNGKGSTHVLHNSTNVHRDSWWSRNLTLDNSIYKLLLTSLRITLLQWNNLNLIVSVAELLGAFLSEQFDSCRLVGFNANIAFSNLSSNHQQFQTYKNFIRAFHHQSIVGCDIRLALYGVYDYALSLSCWRRC